jgi:xanthine dehydrogenase accessory factor
MRDILTELTGLLDQGRECVYCAVVETRGSTPQKAGAAMLVFPDGSQRGTLGGGCVEAEVKQRALRVLVGEASRPEILTFCLDDNYGWDDGLICGGRMSMLVAPLRRTDCQSVLPSGAALYYRRFRELVESGMGCTEAIVIGSQSELPVGNRYLFDACGTLAAQLGEETPTDALTRHLAPLQDRPGPATHHGVAYLPILPRVTLLVVGGGHVGQAVARLAAEVDFDVWVMDDRASYASRERFPAAQRLLVGDIGGTLKELARASITPSTYAIIVTRGHAHDEEALYHLAPLTLPSPPPDGGEGRVRGIGYVGMIGSKRKIKLIYEDLLARGVPGEALERVHAPLGFHIGSQTVPEIAISIVAELIAVRNLGRTIPEARVRVKAGAARS